ncbi:MAG: histidine phosphatase family protein [Chthonomonadaceae bacterium]|nr:histidine phosphatase family protein [Chthonomonadaceae bacterium]
MNKTLYFVRHCAASGQEPDAPLTEEGHEQAETLTKWFADKKIDLIVSSPYLRATQTITPLVQRRKIELRLDSRLEERVLCAETLTDWKEKLRATFDDPFLCFPGGESSHIATHRAVHALTPLLENDLQTIAVVTHGNLLTLILRHFDPTFGYDHWERMTNPDVYCLDWKENTPPVIERVNKAERFDVSHVTHHRHSLETKRKVLISPPP